MASVEVIWNSDDSTHKERLLPLFENARHVDFAIAFARASGFNIIRCCLEAHLSKKGNSARFIFGLDYYQTEPEVLKSVLVLKKKFKNRVKAYVYESQDGSCFHPKIYRFSYAGKVKVCAGSANLTGGGLETNYEFSMIYEEAINGPTKECIDSIADDGIAEELTSERLQRYIPRYQRAKASKAIIFHINKHASQSKIYQFQIRLAQMMEGGAFQEDRDNRRKDRNTAQRTIRRIIDQNSLTEEDFHCLRDTLHSGLLEFARSEILKWPQQFINLLKYARDHRSDEIDDVWDGLWDRRIRKVGRNWLSEVLGVLDNDSFMVMNKNSVAMMELASDEFKVSWRYQNTKGSAYRAFCEAATNIRNQLDLSDFTELDCLFNTMYFEGKSNLAEDEE